MRQNEICGVSVRIKFLGLGIYISAGRPVRKLGPHPTLVSSRNVLVNMMGVFMRYQEEQLNLGEKSLENVRF